MLKHIKFTDEDIKRQLTNEQKHQLALRSCVDKVDVNDYIKPIVKILNIAVNSAIDVANAMPKEYWEARAKLEIGR